MINDRKLPWKTGRSRAIFDKVKKKQKFKDELGNYFIEISKLIFGGIVLGTVLNLDSIHKPFLLLWGLLVTLLFLIFGFVLIYLID